MRHIRVVSPRSKTLLVLFLTLLVFLAVALGAAQAGQSSAVAPALSDLQRLQLMTVAQRIEIAQLKAQAAQRDFDQARQEWSALVTALQVEGFTFDPSTGTYRAKAPDPGGGK